MTDGECSSLVPCVAGITISCMAIGNDADKQLLSSIATTAGGQFYNVVSPVAIPRVVISETRRIARPLLFEYEAGFTPTVTGSHALLDGVPRELPAMTGYVLTTPKDSPLVQSLVESPVPTGDNYPILATWQFGLGRSAAWTSDAGRDEYLAIDVGARSNVVAVRCRQPSPGMDGTASSLEAISQSGARSKARCPSRKGIVVRPAANLARDG